MNRDPIADALRRERRRYRLGDDAACSFCGEGDSVVLKKITDKALRRAIRRKILEAHHPVGAAHDPELRIWLCLNCHAKATEGQRRGCVDFKPQNDVWRRHIERLKSQQAFFLSYADATGCWVEELEAEDQRPDSRGVGKEGQT